MAVDRRAITSTSAPPARNPLEGGLGCGTTTFEENLNDQASGTPRSWRIAANRFRLANSHAFRSSRNLLS